MASSNTDYTNPTEEYFDFGTRYETLLLQQRELYESFLSLPDCDENKNNGGDNNGRKQPSIINVKAGTAAILTNHASMSGMLQSAIYYLKQREKCKKTDDEIEDLTALWEYTLHQQNYDHDLHITQGNDKRIPFGTLCSMVALEDCSNVKDISSHSNTDLDSCGTDEVNGFFEDYPECERRDNLWENLENSNCVDVDDLYNETDTYQVVDRKSLPGSHFTLEMEAGSNSVQTSNRNPSIGSSPEQVKNPYVARSNTLTNSPNRSKNHFGYSSIIDTSWDTSTPKHTQGDIGIDTMPVTTNNYSNNSPGSVVMDYTPQEKYTQRNPFCTAREFKHQNNNDTHVNKDNTKITETKRQFDKNNQGNKIRGEIHITAPAPVALPHNPNRPTLSAGLKRKFQLPKSRNSTTNCPNNTTSKGEGGQMPRQSSKESEEEDLPEELKGLDKELIAKIENEIVDSGDPISFQDIAGLKDAKQAVLELVCWPMKRPDLFTGLRRGTNGLLLFGPPGTGKTLIGKAIAHESGATFFSISSSSLTSKWIGEGEKLVRTLFAVAAHKEPSVVFIDEIDSLLTQRKSDENEASRRIKTEFLVQLDGTGTSGQGRVLAIGATNRPHELDDAARRRFVKRLYIPLPEIADREVLLRTLLEKNSHILSNKDFKKISLDTKGFSGADLKALCTDASLGPIRQLGVRALEVNAHDVPPISFRHFRHALKGMRPSVAQSDLDIYIEWNMTYGSKSLSSEDYMVSGEESDSSSGE